MLRIYFLQLGFNLSDPAVEEAMYDSTSMRGFVGIDLGVEAAHRAFQLHVPTNKLDSSEVLRAPVDQGRLRPSQCVRPVAGLIQPELADSGIDDPSVLAGGQVR